MDRLVRDSMDCVHEPTDSHSTKRRFSAKQIFIRQQRSLKAAAFKITKEQWLETAFINIHDMSL